MKDTIDLVAKTISNNLVQGEISDLQRIGLMHLHDLIALTAYNSGEPQETRECALKALATLPKI